MSGSVRSQKVRPWLMVALLVLLYSVDRLSKLWALREMPGKRIQLTSWFDIALLSNERFIYLTLPVWVAIMATVLVMLVMVALAWREYLAGRLTQVAMLSLVLVGAFSNLLDRIRFDGVVDFLSLANRSVFNLSDLYIVTGVVGLLFLLQREEKKEKQPVAAELDTTQEEA